MKIAMLFPGYSSQFVGMGKELYDDNRIVQEYFEEASNCLDTNFVKLCFASSDIDLAQIERAYPALFLVGCSIFALLKEQGIQPDLVAGYNQGEYTALFAAGGFSFPDGLYLLSKYSLFYQEALDQMEVDAIQVEGLMTSKLEEICLKARASIGVYLSSREHIVTGNIDAVDHVRELTSAQNGVTIDSVSIEGGLHSFLMDSVLDQFKIYLEKVDFKNLTTPFLSAGNDKIISQDKVIRQRIIELINKPILWSQVMNNLVDYDLIIEIGPGNTLTKMVHKAYPDKHAIAINKRADIEELKKIIAL